jgi:hypothetical protein
MASKKRQTHDSFQSHKLTLKSASNLFQKNGLGFQDLFPVRFAHCKYNTSKIA